MRSLRRASAADASALTAALRAALDGGPAVWPVPGAAAGARPLSPTSSETAPAPAEVEDRVALVVETSGSTSRPKRVALSAEALRASAAASAAALGGSGQWLLALPGHYIAGAQVLVRSIVAGTRPIVLGGARFDPRRFVEASARLDRDRLRFTSLVPVQLARLIAGADGEVVAALRGYDAILVGGQALPPALRERADALGARIVRTYGSSETAGGCVYDGRPIGTTRVRLVGGEVELGGPSLAEGYLGDPGRTAAAFVDDADGRWYRTRDLGELAADGRLRVTGRADDVIVSGGVKVALGEVERAVRGVPGFEHAVVLPVADAAWGERTAVVVEADDAARADSEAERLARLVAASDAAGLGPAARPVRLVTVAELPLLASGKPDRLALAELLAP